MQKKAAVLADREARERLYEVALGDGGAILTSRRLLEDSLVQLKLMRAMLREGTLSDILARIDEGEATIRDVQTRIAEVEAAA